MELKFRPLASEDFPLMLDWLSRPHVKEWWDDGEDTLEKVERHYGPEAGVERFILVELQGEVENPIGYFQYYFLDDGSVGIDQFIGEEERINKGLGERAITQFVAMILAEHQPSSVVLDPSPENRRAIRCYEKVGFLHYKTVTTEIGQLAYMMRLDPRHISG